MNKPEQEERRKTSRELLLLLLLLPLGVCLMFTAGQAAIALTPSWVLNADMGSGLDPNVDYKARNNPELMEPILAGILTQPPWADVFLTPGAVIPDGGGQVNVVPPTEQPPVAPPDSPVPPVSNPPSDTVPPVVVVVPPPQPPNPPAPPNPPGQPPEPTKEPPIQPPSDVAVDLKVTKNDGQKSYTANSTVTYLIIVTNIGTNDVNGAVVKDNLPAQVASWDWTCKSATKASGCSAVTGSTSNFTDIVDIQSGGSIEYTVKAKTKTGASGDLINMVSASVPSGYTDTNSNNNTATDMNTKTIILFSADLEIDKDNGATSYVPGKPIAPYTITVTNHGPSLVIGAKVTDIFDTFILTNIKWTCVASSGASCSASGSGNINDSVNLVNRIGPFSRVRPGVRLGEDVHIGNFVEVKASEVGSGSKVNHLAYVGDSAVGANVNIGAGTITCNYDGAYKHRTVIEDDVHIGSDVQLVAPVTVGRGATVGAGTTVWRNVPPGGLVLNKKEQLHRPDWKRPAKKRS